MIAERRRRIESLFLEALSKDPASRAWFLDAACGTDAQLRREVESLLSGAAQTGSFLESAPWATDARALAPGTELGPYRIEARIGVGGMGEVYKACDTRLGRPVAIKMLPPAFSNDPERRRRFEQEARAASALSHPNICTIYDVGEQDGRVFIAMEWIGGPQLGDVIAGGLPTDRALALARQLTAGMAAAHSAGIVHRDIKPANILLTIDDRIKIVDFGLATIVSRSDETTRSATTRETKFMGTPAYASPEQIEGRVLDARTDVFSIGCVLYELFSGHRAFNGVRRDARQPLIAARPEVPQAVSAIVARALAQSADARYANAAELLVDLERLERDRSARRVPVRAILRRPFVIASVAIILLAVGIAGALRWRQDAREQWVRGVALPQARALREKGEPWHFEAFRLLRTAESLTPTDPQLKELLEEASVAISVSSDPAGTDVWFRDFRDGGEQWEYLGRTPLSARVPAYTPFLWKVAHEGFLTQIVIGYSTPPQAQFSLVPAAGAPEGMVWMSAGRQEFYNASATLDSFWIDRVEVTNRAFLDFVRGGGYARSELWTHTPLGVLATLLDKSGRPGPSTWDLGLPPEGRENHPVTGVSWYEARAYCRSVGKDLPTLFHWYYAAEPGATTQWASLSNFQSSGTVPGGDPLHLNTYGTYDMAGNAREWTRTASTGDFRYALGGSYAEGSYTFSDFWVHRSGDRDPHLGFRCAKYTSLLPEDQTRAVATPFRDYRVEQPASDEQYRIMAPLYDYDRSQPLDGKIEKSDDDVSSQFRLQLVSFAAAYGGERIRAFLLLPKNTGPPYQVVVWFPGAGPFWGRSAFDTAGETTWFQFLVRGGRAVLLPEYMGSFERWLGRPNTTRNWQEIAVHAGKDIRRALDYLETRPDVDASRIAYYGLSMGASIGGIMTAIEPRFKASILLGGGLYPWTRPAHAEIFNFLPHVHVPTLMINGKFDYFYPVETSQTPMFNRIGTTRKRHLKYESGHIPSEREDFAREIVAWLDEYLGPVTLR